MAGKLASRNYRPGDLICSLEPFAQVLQRELKDILCETCGEGYTDLKRCKQCLSVKYCGKTCQINDWSTHKLECKYLSDLPEGRKKDTDIVRLLGKIILMTKNKKWKNIKVRILGVDISFDDVDCHWKDMTENTRLNLHYKELKALTTRYIGAENMPSDEDLIKIVGKITIPSRMLIYNTRIFIDDEDYSCMCSDCRLPYGESVLTKIIDEEKAHSVLESTKRLLIVAGVLKTFDLESCLTNAVDKLLCEQEGVLGNSNIHHLKLLAFRCLKMEGDLLTITGLLLKLEKDVSSVYGEYSVEMRRIYESLVIANFELGNDAKARHYVQKVKAVEYHKDH